MPLRVRGLPVTGGEGGCARGGERQEDEEDREHQAEGVGAVADQEREEVRLHDLGGEDEEPRGGREGEQ